MTETDPRRRGGRYMKPKGGKTAVPVAATIGDGKDAKANPAHADYPAAPPPKAEVSQKQKDK